jgi:AcrR family transcriptional regulator
MDIVSIIDMMSRSVKSVELQYYSVGMSTQPTETIQARSGRRRRQATVADILDATRRLLAKGTPVANLSLEQIVTEAGIARATFYLHFPDKHALIARLAEDEIAWREQIGAEVLADPELERATLDAIMLEIVTLWSADRAILSAIIALAGTDERVNSIWLDAMQQVADKAATHAFATARASWCQRGQSRIARKAHLSSGSGLGVFGVLIGPVAAAARHGEVGRPPDGCPGLRSRSAHFAALRRALSHKLRPGADAEFAEHLVQVVIHRAVAECAARARGEARCADHRGGRARQPCWRRTDRCRCRTRMMLPAPPTAARAGRPRRVHTRARRPGGLARLDGPRRRPSSALERQR